MASLSPTSKTKHASLKNSSPRGNLSWKKLRRASDAAHTLKRRHSYQAGDDSASFAKDGDSPKLDSPRRKSFAAEEMDSPRRKSFADKVQEDANLPTRHEDLVTAYKKRQVYSHARSSLQVTSSSQIEADVSPRRNSFSDTSKLMRDCVRKVRYQIQASEALMSMSYTKRCERMAREHFLELTRTAMDGENVLDFGKLSVLLGVVIGDISNIEVAHPEMDFNDLKGRITKAQYEGQSLQKAKDDVSRCIKDLQAYLESNDRPDKRKEDIKQRLSAGERARSMFIQCAWDMRKCFYDCGMVEDASGEERELIISVAQEIQNLPDKELQSLKNVCLHDTTDDNAIQEVTLLNITRLGMKLDKSQIIKVVAELRRTYWEAEVGSEFQGFMKLQKEMIGSLESVMRQVEEKVKRPTRDSVHTWTGGNIVEPASPRQLGETRLSHAGSEDEQARQFQQMIDRSSNWDLNGRRRSAGSTASQERISEDSQQALRFEAERTATAPSKESKLTSAQSTSKEPVEVSSPKVLRVSDAPERRFELPKRKLKRRVTTGMLPILMRDMVTGESRVDYAANWSLRDIWIKDLWLEDASAERKIKLQAGKDSAVSATPSTAFLSSASADSAAASTAASAEAATSIASAAASATASVAQSRRTLPAPRDSKSRALVELSAAHVLDDKTVERRLVRYARRNATYCPAGVKDTTNSTQSSPTRSRPSSRPSPRPVKNADSATVQSRFSHLPVVLAGEASRPSVTSEGCHAQGSGILARRSNFRLPSLREQQLALTHTGSQDHMRQRWKYVRMQRQRACGRAVASVAWLQDAQDSCPDSTTVSTCLPDIRGRRPKVDSSQVGSMILLTSNLVSPTRPKTTAYRRTRERWNILS